MTTRKTDAELKSKRKFKYPKRDEIPFVESTHCDSCGLPWMRHLGIAGTCARNLALLEGLKKAKEALERTKKLTLGPSFELQDSIMCEVLEALREIRALLSTEAQQ